MPSHSRLILALDVPGADAALAWARRLGPRIAMVKVGLELFVAAGPDIVKRLRGEDMGVFLDLKLHDIPNTVAGAVRSAAALDVQMLTVHAGGGGAMLAAAAGAADGCGFAGRLLAVTVLTSLDADALAAIGIGGTPAERALAWAQDAQRQGIGGAVASAHEAAALRAACGPKFTLVIPGIRPAGAAKGDQARVATPAQAIADGADYLVVGRALTAAANPESVADAMNAEVAAALSS